MTLYKSTSARFVAAITAGAQVHALQMHRGTGSDTSTRAAAVANKTDANEREAQAQMQDQLRQGGHENVTPYSKYFCEPDRLKEIDDFGLDDVVNGFDGLPLAEKAKFFDFPTAYRFPDYDERGVSKSSEFQETTLADPNAISTLGLRTYDTTFGQGKVQLSSSSSPGLSKNTEANVKIFFDTYNAMASDERKLSVDELKLLQEHTKSLTTENAHALFRGWLVARNGWAAGWSDTTWRLKVQQERGLEQAIAQGDSPGPNFADGTSVKDPTVRQNLVERILKLGLTNLQQKQMEAAEFKDVVAAAENDPNVVSWQLKTGDSESERGLLQQVEYSLKKNDDGKFVATQAGTEQETGQSEVTSGTTTLNVAFERTPSVFAATDVTKVGGRKEAVGGGKRPSSLREVWAYTGPSVWYLSKPYDLEKPRTASKGEKADGLLFQLNDYGLKFQENKVEKITKEKFGLKTVQNPISEWLPFNTTEIQQIKFGSTTYTAPFDDTVKLSSKTSSARVNGKLIKVAPIETIGGKPVYDADGRLTADIAFAWHRKGSGGRVGCEHKVKPNDPMFTHEAAIEEAFRYHNQCRELGMEDVDSLILTWYPTPYPTN